MTVEHIHSLFDPVRRQILGGRVTANGIDDPTDSRVSLRGWLQENDPATDTQLGPSKRHIAAPEVKTGNPIHMNDITDVLAQSISAILFASYGLYALLSERMEAEFKRYGLAPFRTLTGLLQLAGSIGLIVGPFYRPLLLISAGGFTVMMILAVITRFKIKDPLYAALPAFALGVLNFFIFATAL